MRPASARPERRRASWSQPVASHHPATANSPCSTWSRRKRQSARPQRLPTSPLRVPDQEASSSSRQPFHPAAATPPALEIPGLRPLPSVADQKSSHHHLGNGGTPPLPDLRPRPCPTGVVPNFRARPEVPHSHPSVSGLQLIVTGPHRHSPYGKSTIGQLKISDWIPAKPQLIGGRATMCGDTFDPVVTGRCGRCADGGPGPGNGPRGPGPELRSEPPHLAPDHLGTVCGGARTATGRGPHGPTATARVGPSELGAAQNDRVMDLSSL